ncbi:MAG: AbrB/MazE/SpoVT family DNA-binding domain-containing protein [Clostridiales bacterium]|nr:AbrB/MazE/SpoVT family DNA-binding domain-containing protein [Clostridiales bacterium]
MKTIGIVRRIDELGRVVIPKELRRTMHLKEGEEMEVFVAPDNSLVLKKYSVVKELADLAQDYADIIYSITNTNCLICDLDYFVAASIDKNVYLNNRISKALEGFLMNRKAEYLKGDKVINLLKEEDRVYKDMAIAPIMVGGDVLGGIIMPSPKGFGELSLKLVEVASGFIAKHI